MIVKKVINLLILPEGGSNVIFTPFYRTEIGKSLDGIEVNHKRKSLFKFSLKSSTILSSSDIHEIAK